MDSVPAGEQPLGDQPSDGPPPEPLYDKEGVCHGFGPRNPCSAVTNCGETSSLTCSEDGLDSQRAPSTPPVTSATEEASGKAAEENGHVDTRTFIATRPWVRTPDVGERLPNGEQEGGRGPSGAAIFADGACAVLVTADLFLTPIFCFALRRISWQWTLALAGVDALCLADAALRTTGHRMTSNRLRYLRRRLPIDILSSFPFELFVLAGD